MKSRQIKSTNIYPKAVNNKVVESKEYNNLQQDVNTLYPNIISYTNYVAFNYACIVVHHTLISNDTLEVDSYNAIPGGGAIYVVTADGTHSPTFSSTFKKSSSSGDYVPTLGTINLITFLFDGINYWYNIVQPA